MDIAYTFTTERPLQEIEQAIRTAVTAQGFRVLHVHDVQATLAEKGLAREPYKIIEICNARYAHRALATSPYIGLMMPCKINVWVEQGKTHVALLKPSLLATMFPNADMNTVAQEVELALRAVMDAVEHQQ
ncbi:MAG: DUF302 domain-containing protein [Anaerolineae bacterium]|nr:DUF302 domain-containing protein [Anaerolineae bacterium]